MLPFLVGLEAARGRRLHLLRLRPPRRKYVISNFASSLFFLIHKAFLRLIPYACLLISFPFFFFFFWQSKHKEDTSATHPILPNKLKLEVYPFLLHAFPMSHVTTCSFFCSFLLYIYISLPILPSPLLFLLFSG